MEEELPVLVLIMNDYCLGMISQLQDAFYSKRYQACHFGKKVNFARLAESMGALGLRVSEEKDIAAAIGKGLSAAKPCVIDFILEDASNVYPMVVGASLLEYVE
ncbi:Acetolactate synthase large subunit [subsurface metagenome]